MSLISWGCRLSHINCPQQISALTEYLASPEPAASTRAPALIEMLHTTLWGTQHSELTLDLAEQRLRANPSKDWYRRVIHTRLTPLKKVARAINERLKNVVSYCQHKITNGVTEGINSKIMSIKRRVGGYRNPENFKTAIYFYCGGLQMHP